MAPSIKYCLPIKTEPLRQQSMVIPRTPYPFDLDPDTSKDQKTHNDHQLTLESISEWLDVQQDDEYCPEGLALTPDGKVASENEDVDQWVVGPLDWLEECKPVEQQSSQLQTCEDFLCSGCGCSECETLVSSSSDDTSQGPLEDLVAIEGVYNREKIAEVSSESPLQDTPVVGGDKQISLHSRGPLRRRSTVEDDDSSAPPMKRPRLERLVIEEDNTQTPEQVFPPKTPTCGPTPVSPNRGFIKILAEWTSEAGEKMYKVAWRDSWVHEDRMPDVESIRDSHFIRFGEHWEVVS